MATIKVRQNGSYLVDGEDVKLIDWNGNEYELAKRPFALCRCGHSTRKPFCDGTHSKMGFQAAEDALGRAAADRSAREAKEAAEAAAAAPAPAPPETPDAPAAPAPPADDKGSAS